MATDEQEPRRPARRLELHGAPPLPGLSHDELAVLCAVCWIGVERRAPDGVRPAAVRVELSLPRRDLRRILRCLTAAGALEPGGPRFARTVSLTDAGLATIAGDRPSPTASLPRM